MSGEAYFVNDKTQMSYRVFLLKLEYYLFGYRLRTTYLRKNNIIGRFGLFKS